MDPIQSVKGKVVIDAFRTIDPTVMMTEEEFQQHTSNLGSLKRPTIQALYNGLNKHYYSIVIGYHKNENEQNMLLNLYRKKWNHGFKNSTTKESKRDNKSDLEVESLGNSQVVQGLQQVDQPREPKNNERIRSVECRQNRSEEAPQRSHPRSGRKECFAEFRIQYERKSVLMTLKLTDEVV